MKSEIIYEDDSIYVIYKPAGIAVQSMKVTEIDVVSELKSYAVKKGQKPYLGIVHRIDQPVEGVLVFAKDKSSAAALTNQLQTESLGKSYLAAVYVGKDEVLDAANIENYIVKEKNLARIVLEKAEEAKIAKLSYKKISEYEKTMLIQVKISTGRFHQIRAQMSYFGLPLLGDQKYGTEESLTYSQACGIRTVALCANVIEFKHPKTKKNMRFEIEPRNQAFKNI